MDKSIDDYNKKNDGSIKLKKLTVEKKKASLTMSYASTDEYTDFNGTKLFSGTIAEALAAGYDFKTDFAAIDDGKAKKCESSEFLDETGYKVVVYEGSSNLHVKGKILYASVDKVKLVDDKTVAIGDKYSLLASQTTGTESVTESMKNNGLQIEKLSCQIANWNRAQAQNRMTQLIGQYKNSIELVIANNDAMALGAIDAYEKLGVTESNVPAFFGVDGTDDGLEAVQQSKLAATVYNDKEGQARAMAQLAYLAATGGSMKNIKFEDKKYVYLPYEKVTPDNVNEFVKDEQ